MRKLLNIFALAAMAMTGGHSVAQEAPKPLFDYPLAPDTCSTLESRSNYVITHFWDSFDLTKPISDDLSLIKTFRDYADLFKYGHRTVVMSGIRDFMFKLRGNATNLSKVGRVAEAVLYGPMADYWSDEVYVEFAKSLAAATVLKKEEREYYQRQIGLISLCQEGMPLNIEFTDATSGAKTKLADVPGKLFLVVFMNDGVDSSIDRTRLVTDVTLEQIVNEGQITVVCLNEGQPAGDWAASMPEKWVKGYGTKWASQLDLRAIPGCYMLDGEHKIMHKNITVADFKAALE
ncbi:MAG: DUF5106 domain-containing protein [Muribaculaceae bacterium]|nr:DUF5106 domain-containing protein [Muribaculaceae bacterium]